MKHVEIEDVLSSIRRLVSEEPKPRQKSREIPKPDRLVLTPSLRVPDTAAIAEAARPRPKFSTSRTESRPVAPTPPATPDPVLLTDPTTRPDSKGPDLSATSARGDSEESADEASGRGGMLARLVEQEVARAFSDDESLEDDEPRGSRDSAASEPAAEASVEQAGRAEAVPEDAAVAFDEAPVISEEAGGATGEPLDEPEQVRLEDAPQEATRPEPVAEQPHADARPDPIAQFVQHMDGVERLNGADSDEDDLSEEFEDEGEQVSAYLDDDEPKTEAETVLQELLESADADGAEEASPVTEPEHALAPQQTEIAATGYSSLQGKIAVLEMLVARQRRASAPEAPAAAEIQAVTPTEAASEPPVDDVAEVDAAQMGPDAGTGEIAAGEADTPAEPVEELAAYSEPETSEEEASVAMAEQPDLTTVEAAQPEPEALRHFEQQAEEAPGDQVLNWEDHLPAQEASTAYSEEAADHAQDSRAADEASQPANVGTYSDLPATSAGGQAPALPALDEEMLRDMVSDIVRQELQGVLGERITRNVRKLVRREIHRVLMSQELD